MRRLVLVLLLVSWFVAAQQAKTQGHPTSARRARRCSSSPVLRVTATTARERDRRRLRKLQIKGRCVPPGCKRRQRIGRVDVNKDWDAVLLVLLDEYLDTTAIYEALRAPVLAALAAPGSFARNEYGALSVSKFKAIGKLRWPPATEVEP